MTNYVGLALLIPVKAINHSYRYIKQFGQKKNRPQIINFAENFLHNSLLAYSNVINIFGATGKELTENLLLQQFVGLASQLFRFEQANFSLSCNYTVLLEPPLCFNEDEIAKYENIIAKAFGLDGKNISIKLAGSRSLETDGLTPKSTPIALKVADKEVPINTISFCYYNIEITLPKNKLKACIKSALKSVCSNEVSAEIFEIIYNAVSSYKKQESSFKLAEKIVTHADAKIMIRIDDGEKVDMRTLPQEDLEGFVSGKIEVPKNIAVFAKRILAERKALEKQPSHGITP